MLKASKRMQGASVGLAVAVFCLFGGNMTAKAALGLDREAYGVWDREGGHSVSTYPYTRGQEYQAEWTAVHTARSNYNWTALDAAAQFAYDQNQRFFVKIQPVSSTTVPPWMFSAGVPQISCQGGLTYGYYLDPEFKLYFSEMVAALGKHLREELPVHLRSITSFVRCDTGATGDEGPYDPVDLVKIPTQYLISEADWRDYRIWAFGLYDQAMQHGTGTAIPIIFQDVETPVFQIEQDWVKANVTSGWGAKYGGQVRGHHLSESRNVPDSFKAYAMDTPMKFFSANEMDQTWEKFYFQLNVPLSFYWCAAESLNAGLSIQDWSGGAIEGAAANNFEFAAVFFNTWAAELDPPTARGGFCIFHEGLDSANTNKFPEATYGSPAKMSNTARYTAICAAYSSQGAKMDDLNAATWGQVAQRRDQRGFNDAGWEIWPDNYERFITQINPDNTSKAVWRVNNLTTSSHPYDRFARRFDSASGKNTMYFDVNDRLTPTPGQSIKLSVVYRDSGTGQFGLLYDAVGNSQKSAFTVTKGNSNTWKTNTVTVTDWVFGNNGPNGADLILTSVDSNDDTFSRIELVKLVNVTMNVVGSGTVSARNDFTVYSPVSGTYATGQRLDMTVTPVSGYEFSGWSGDLSGSNSRAIFFPTNVNNTITATFANTGVLSSTDDFESGTWTGGTGWSGGWTAVATATPGSVVQLNVAGSITRTLGTPIPNATLSFSWDVDRIALGTEYGYAEVYDGTWHTVWSQTDKGLDSGSTPELLTTNIILSAYGAISQVRFRLAGSASTDRFWIDNVSLTGMVARYTLTVTNGSGSGSYTNGARVAIAAYPVAGKTFYRWTGSTQVVNNVTYTNALVTMSTNAVSLTATYADVYYALTAVAGANGIISPTNASVVFGGSTNFVITASNYYRIATLTTNGTAVTGISFDNNSITTNFTWSNVRTSGVLAATFTARVVTNAANTPHSWLAGYGLTNGGVTFDQAAAVDQDGDGLTAWQEYVAGTVPTNQSSALKLDDAILSGEGMRVSWFGVQDRAYTLQYQYSDSLSTNWQSVSNETQGADAVLYLTNSLPAGVFNAFYRVKVRLGDSSVSATNILGCTKIAVPSDQYVLAALNFNNESNTIDGLFGNLPTGSKVYTWNSAAQSYTIATKTRSGWGDSGTNRVQIGAGAFINLPAGVQTNVLLSGDVPTAGITAVHKATGYSLISYPYPVLTPFTNTALAKTAFTGDKIFIWQNTGWVTYSKTRGGWIGAEGLQLKPGQAFFFRAAGSGGSVNEIRPYTVN